MGLKRIVLHWSAGTHTVSGLDRSHYHFIVGGDAKTVAGVHAPEANIRPVKGRYAAHTLNCNTGSIGVAVAAMAGAVERPFNPGKYPITPAQLDALAALVAGLCRRYGIPVSRTTVLTHAEVQSNLGIKQRGKWDINWLPGLAGPVAPTTAGDEIRRRVCAALGATK